jgi:CHAD domain-containing protein
MKLWKPKESVAANARRVLPGKAEAYFAAGDAVATDNATPEKLHEFRLATKSFRYMLELFVPVYGPGLTARIGKVKKVQQHLGVIQDCETLLGMGLKDAKLDRYARERMKTRKQEFLDYWRSDMSSATLRKQWSAYFKRYAKEP